MDDNFGWVPTLILSGWWWNDQFIARLPEGKYLYKTLPVTLAARCSTDKAFVAIKSVKTFAQHILLTGLASPAL